MNPYGVVSIFEDMVSKYTGSPYAIAVDSCTNALFLCLKYLNITGECITIPSHTYMSVPCSIINSGNHVEFEESEPILTGAYRLKPTCIWDSALRFTSDMYIEGQMMCLSFSGPRKILKLGKGGIILTDNKDASDWLKRARYHGRNPIDHKVDNFDMIGWNFYMPVDTAARGSVLMMGMRDNKDVSEKYQDLSKFEVYRK